MLWDVTLLAADRSRRIAPVEAEDRRTAISMALAIVPRSVIRPTSARCLPFDANADGALETR